MAKAASVILSAVVLKYGKKYDNHLIEQNKPSCSPKGQENDNVFTSYGLGAMALTIEQCSSSSRLYKKNCMIGTLQKCIAGV